MPILNEDAVVQNEGKDFEVIPEGLWNVQVVDLELKKDQEGYQGKKVDKIYIRTGILDEELRGKSLMHFVSKAYTAGWDKGSPSKLYEFCCAVYGQNLNDEDKMDLNTLIGGKLKMLVKHKQGTDGKVRFNVAEVMKIDASGSKLPELTEEEILALMPNEKEAVVSETGSMEEVKLPDEELDKIMEEIDSTDFEAVAEKK
jgi:hypothetical protein